MSIEEFLKLNAIIPNNIIHYKIALTHPSATNHKNKLQNYQRLEFLGDALLYMIVSEQIFNSYPNMDEGQMSILRSEIINKENLSHWTKKSGLVNLIRTGLSFQKNTLTKDSKFLSDVYESLIGAIFIDQGIEKTKEFVNKTLLNDLDNLSKKELKNPKTILQEKLQAISNKDIKYETSQKKDIFLSKVLFDDIVLGKGRGKTKQSAEINAAKDALKKDSNNKGG